MENIRTSNLFIFYVVEYLSFSKIETTRLIDKGTTYQILTTFKKPLGEQTFYEEPPIPNRKSHSKHRSKKRTRAPSNIEYEKPIRRPSPVSIHEEEEEKRSPRIYTEEIQVRLTNKFLFVLLCFFLNRKTEHWYHFLILMPIEVNQRD